MNHPREFPTDSRPDGYDFTVPDWGIDINPGSEEMS